jgi:hypothetical protein
MGTLMFEVKVVLPTLQVMAGSVPFTVKNAAVELANPLVPLVEMKVLFDAWQK